MTAANSKPESGSNGHSSEPRESCVREFPVHLVPRRRALAAGVLIGLNAGLPARSALAASPANERPVAGDIIVYRFGDKAGQSLKPADVPDGAELVQVFTKDPASGTVRDGSRLNGINVVRVKASNITPELREYAAGGVVAFSSVCTHQGCDLTQWHPDKNRFECFCHASEFDVLKLGAPVHGPARRSLAVLPLGLDASGYLVAAGPFIGKVGFKA